MKNVVRVVAVVAVSGVLEAGASGASGAGAHAAKTKTCNAQFTEGRGASRLTVTNDTCAKARAVANRVLAIGPAGCLKVLDHKGHLAFRKPCVRLSYHCSATTYNNRKSLRVVCTRGSRQIRFRY
jgi:hypothetical protein